jgi:hypothetical protein
MKFFAKSVVLSLMSALLVPALSHAQPVEASVVHEDPDGALIVRAGSSMALASGDELQDMDVIKSNDSTVIVSLCNGSLVTVYPDSEVMFTGIQTGIVRISIIQGEILGDIDPDDGCEIGADTLAGTIDISSGVYGVLMNEGPDGWTLQVRNLDGTVTFTGDAGLDTSNLTVSLVNPGETTDIPAGDELIVRGVYDPVTEIFSLISGGAAMSIIPDDVIGDMNDGVEGMQAVGRPDDLPARERAVPTIEDTDTPAEDKAVPVILEIPWKDIETASDRGSRP